MPMAFSVRNERAYGGARLSSMRDGLADACGIDGCLLSGLADARAYGGALLSSMRDGLADA